MSQLTNVVLTEFRVKGGAVTAEMGRMGSAFGQMGQQINETTRMSEKFGQQWRAIGTTVRYALAGGVVFGLTGVLTQLKEIQQQMGLISAIGSVQGGSGLITGGNLTKLMAEARQGAVDSITPLQDFNNAIINILSTVANVPENQIVPIATEIAKAAKLAQINAEDATKAFTTMNVAFGQKPTLKNIHRTAQEFFILTKEAPGGAAAGQQIITQLGQMAAVTKAAGGTQEDIFSLYLTGLRGGIPPAQLGRGLQFMIQTLALPSNQSPRSKGALASVGITATSHLNLQQRISRVMAKARSFGVSGSDISKLKNIDPDSLDQFDSLGDQGSSAALSSLGISGRGVEFLGKVFPRIHALRAALSVMNELNSGNAQQDFKTMTEAAQGHVKAVDDLAKAWKRFSSQAKLQAATIAISAMGQQVATVFAPLTNFGATGIVGLQRFLAHHAHGTGNASMAGAGAIVGLSLLKLAGVSPLAALKGGRGGLFGASALTAELTGGGGKNVMTGLGNHPTNPLFVYVVNSLGPLGSGGAAATEGTVVAKAEKSAAATMLRRGGAASIGSRIASAGGRSLSARVVATAAGAAAAALAVPILEAASVGFHPANAEAERRIYEYAQSSPAAAARYAKKEGFKLNAGQITAISKGGFFPGMFGGSMAVLGAQRMYHGMHPNDPSNITRVFQTAFQNINGKAYVTLDVNLTHPGGKVERKRIVEPISLWTGGSFPSSKGGKPGSRN